ncbi:tetratricopeptide repeat-containing protein [Cardiosporidium cionae]|uniref:Tetratricopeptide repeat-containing protein n=1 Tax=Cardiosporidium cionae TaxID=476202 RepID=A0ABQ7J6P6_9APIC|nr:tetratricopeptide repeat-containing protein [Cardiosporidium cionae]|eukprot:KAF8819653.1 tetratricopeptide repeat-containing protein [Cardiosporidium cionae]
MQAETEPSPITVDEFLSNAERHLASFPPDVDSAKHIFDKALRLFPENPDILAAYGEFHCEAGDAIRAVELLQKSIDVEPNKNAARYFYLGQLQSGKDACPTFKKGIQIIHAEIKNETTDLDFAKKQLSSAYCALAELYMTDLCDESNAEEECIKYFEAALKENENSVEAHHCKALYNKVIGDLDVALEEAKKCLALLKSIERGSIPSIEIRTNLSRTLIDLNETTSAISLLESCLAEDEEDMQVWYVLSCAHMITGNLEDALDCTQKASDCLKSSELYGDASCSLNYEIPALIKEIQKRQASSQTSFDTSMANTSARN